MSEPKDIAQKMLAEPEPEPARVEHLTKVLEMVQAAIQAAITIRSVSRDKRFISMSGGEDAGTKFDRRTKRRRIVA